MRAADVLTEVRRQAGLTQQELARRGRTAQPTVAAYESGRKQPGVATLDRLVRAAGLRLSWRLDRVESPLAIAAADVEAAVAVGDDAAALRHVAVAVSSLDELIAHGG